MNINYVIIHVRVTKEKLINNFCYTRINTLKQYLSCNRILQNIQRSVIFYRMIMLCNCNTLIFLEEFSLVNIRKKLINEHIKATKVIPMVEN